MPHYKQIDINKEGAWHVFLVMGDVVIFDQPPVSEVRVSGQPSPHTGGSEPARPPPGRTIINKRGLGLHYLVVQRGISAGHGRL